MSGSRRFTIATTVAVGVVALGAATTLVLVEHHRFSQLIVAKAQELLDTQAQLSARRVEQFFQEHAAALETLVGSVPLASCSRAEGRPAAGCAQAAALRAFYKHHRDDVSGIAILDAHGQVIAHGAPAAVDPHPAPSAATLEAVQRAGRATFVADNGPAGNHPSVTLWQPLQADDQVVGFARVDMNVSEVYERFFQQAQLGREACSWVIDRHGTVVAHHKPGEIGRPFMATKERHLRGDDLRNMRAMYQRAIAGESGGAVFTCPEDGKRIAVFTPASFGDVLWSVGVTIGYDDIAEPIARHLRSTIGISASTLMLLGLMGYGWQSSRRRSANLEVEAELARQVAASATALTESEARNRRLEERLRASKELEALGNLAAGIAHDYNNILTAILGYLSVARDPQTDDAARLRTLHQAELAAQRAKELTARLLTFSRGGAPVHRPVDLASLVRETVELATAAAPRPVTVEIDAAVGPVALDLDQVQQALLAVLTNAIEASEGDAELEVKLRRVELGPDSELPLPRGCYAWVSCADRGPGVDPDLGPSIFDPYVSSKALGAEHGRGMGLTVAHSVVARHGGHIGYRDRPGGGTVFDIYLPMHPPAETATTPRVARPSAELARVLVMDDDAIVLELAELIYHRLGFTVVTASDGRQALQAYTQACDAGHPFDLVVLDLSVPGGMGGLETLRRLQEIDPQVRAVVSSGYSNDPVAANHAEHGFAAALPKPYTFDDVRRMLERVIHPS